MTQQKPTLLSPQFGKTPSPEMQRKVKQMIRKKASLYGIQELANPSIHANHLLLFSSRLANNKTQMRSKSSLTNIPSTKNLKSARNNINVDQQGQPAVKASVIPSYKLDSKTNQQRIFPPLNSLRNLIESQKQVVYIFRDKLDYDLNDIVYEYLKILELAIAHESQIFAHKIVPHKGILIPTLEFLAESFFQCQFNKIVLVFSIIGLNLCEFYKQLDRVGKFLFIISKVLRKMEKYQECEITLKKALEYVWYAKGLHNMMGEDKDQNKDNKDNNKDQKDLKDNKSLTRNNSNLSQQKVPKSNPKPSSKQPQLKQITSKMQSSQPYDSPSKKNPTQKNNQSTLHYSQPHRQKLLQQYTNTELQIYNELSYCLLQLNKKEESRVFGQKYEIGYLQKQTNSSVMNLSKDLITSAQKRIIPWQRVDKRRFDLIFGIELDKYLSKYGQTIKDKFQEPKFIKALKVNIDLLIDNLFKGDMFFYEVPLITQFKDKELEMYKKSHHKLPVLTQKFVYKKKSLTQGGRTSSIPGNIKKFKNDNVGGNKIFNYRGVGLSRTKLTTLFKEYIRFIETKLGHKEVTAKLPPVLSYGKSQLASLNIKPNNKVTLIQQLDKLT